MSFRLVICLAVSAFLYISDSALPMTKRRLQQQQQQQQRQPFTQFDILVPLTNRDDTLRRFAERLRPSLQLYREISANNATLHLEGFRLVTTRYTAVERRSLASFQRELSQLSGLPLDQIVLVQPPPEEKEAVFSRAHAANLMLRNGACHDPHCIVALMDVDMDIKAEFFGRAENIVKSGEQVYFPTVWSRFQKESAELVQWNLDRQQHYSNKNSSKISSNRIVLGPYSEHVGHWRDHGTGMWAMAGPDAKIFRFNEAFQGWGGEDGDFYDRVKEKRKIVRYREKGLIHLWHPKSCLPNVTVFTDRQLQACKASRQGEAGSELGRKMLEKWFVQHPEAIYDGN